MEANHRFFLILACVASFVNVVRGQDSTQTYRKSSTTFWTVAKIVLPAVAIGGAAMYFAHTQRANQASDNAGYFLQQSDPVRYGRNLLDEYDNAVSKAGTYAVVGGVGLAGSIAAWTLAPKDTTYAERNIDIQFSQGENLKEQESNPGLPQISLLPNANFIDTTAENSYRISAHIRNVFNPKVISLHTRDLKTIPDPAVMTLQDGLTVIWSIGLTEGLNEYLLVALNSIGRSARKISIVRLPKP